MMLASNPRAIATHYVPEDPAEICFSPILNPGDQYTVYFQAPQEPGEYRMVCTYPGHWRVMQGSLFVLPDEAPLPPQSDDETARRFVRQWTLSELSDPADDLKARSFARGRSVFSQAGCVKCHRIRDDGSQLGPDLTRISDRFRGTRLLQHILEPSLEINRQYQTWVAVTTDGRTVAGLLIDQTPETITLLPNPLRPEERVTLTRNSVEELVASTQSTMPTGLLMVFEQDEILDLLAYIQAGGESTHRVFRP
jgi:putative heme-binding domain-containing protein